LADGDHEGSANGEAHLPTAQPEALDGDFVAAHRQDGGTRESLSEQYRRDAVGVGEMHVDDVERKAPPQTADEQEDAQEIEQRVE